MVKWDFFLWFFKHCVVLEITSWSWCLNLWLTLIFRFVVTTFLCLSRICSRLKSPEMVFLLHTHTYAAQTNWTIILGVEQRPCLADIYSFFLTPNDVVKVNGATSLRGFRTSQCLKILKMASEGQYFIIKFWFQAWNISGTQKVSGAATRWSQLLWWFQRA